ncbi:hypothetical protein MVEN_02524600 [Mycena venus]|uniref:Leucine-rich repeat-containing protein 40 n=1 Tax=Mycena venus TaxID=2733690 RepID=A0A8H7CAA5_9AGAR|nr:hypothetical protein MVEN_02524600 [Mycena venus]
MSRIPQPSRGTPRKAAASPTKLTAPSSAPRTRTQSTVVRATTPSKATRKPYADTDSFLNKPKAAQEEPPSKPLSIKEAIAQKRAQAKKVQTSGGVSPLDDLSSLADAVPNAPPPEDEDILGRPPLRETIERAKSTGSVNLSTRSLQCIPSALFDIHLGITPEPLKSVPEEPPLPPAPETGPRRKHTGPAWYETQDLEILKAWGNEIVEIQPEIALFGSLKSIDLHRNKIVSLPDQFADLAALTTLDLSHNALTSLPANLFSLPALSNLNVSNNALTSLPFSAPFSSAAKSRSTGSAARGLFGGPEITRATTPLPKLAIFDASNNQLTAGGIHLDIPKSIVTLDLSENPLESDGSQACSKLFAALATLQRLKVLRCEKADLSDGALEGISRTPGAFPAISVLDFGSTKVTESGATRGLKGLAQELTFEITNEDPPAGVARVIIGKKIVREAWELEAERRSKARAGKAADSELGLEWENAPPSRAKAAAQPRPGAQVSAKAPIVKEAWEIEAEQGLLTEGGRRRARAAAAAAAADGSGLGHGAPPRQPSPTPKTPSLADSQYYTARTETLVLPALTAPPKLAGHARAFSLAAPSLVKSLPDRASDVALPTATLPLSLIAVQPFAQTLKVLHLTNRRMDRSFTLPPAPHADAPLLPRLEELSLEGCNLGDAVPIARAAAEETTPLVPVPGESTPLLPLLTALFPRLRALNLAYNALTGAALSGPALAALVLCTCAGNRIADLDGLREIALRFRGNRTVPEWGLEELDVRDNEIGRLPAELGMLPLDVFLVDGNVFRVPARRVWEREGTKGLLSWLRGRME